MTTSRWSSRVCDDPSCPPRSSRRTVASIATAAGLAVLLAAAPASAANNPGTGDPGFFTFRPAPAIGGTQINVASGNALIRTRDLASSAANYNVVVDRAYNSLAPDTFSILSPRWAFDVGPTNGLTVESNQDVTVAGPSGYKIRFERQSNGGYTPPTGFDGSLTKTSSGWTLARTSQSDQFGYDNNGKLVWTQDAVARDFTVQGTSAAGRDVLSSYGTSSGRRVNLSYTGDSLVREMDDPSSGHHYYRYTNGRLTQYEAPNGAATGYRYNSAGRLDKITEPGGTTVELDTTAGGRVSSITTTLPGGIPQTTSFIYTRRPYKTDVTGPDGVRRTYAYDDDWRVTRQYNPDVKPTVTAEGELRDLADGYVGPNRTYPLAVAAQENDGSGLRTLKVELSSGSELASATVPCATTPFDTVCPTTYQATLDASFAAVSEGRQQIRAAAIDDEQNRGSTGDWAVLVDRTAPKPADDLRLTFFDPGAADGTASLAWNTDDPDLADGNPGSGVVQSEVRSRTNGGPFSAWTTVADDSVDLPGIGEGDSIEFEVRSTDAVGNVSSTASKTVTASEQLDDPLILDAAAQAFMERHGGTFAAARSWMTDQAKVGNVGDDGIEAVLRDAVPGNYGGTWADNSIRKYRVQVTSAAVQADAQSALNANGVGSLAQVDVVSSTIGELSDAHETLNNDLRDLLDAGLVSTSRKASANAIRITIAGSANAAQRARVSAAAAAVPVDVNVENSPDPTFATEDTGCRFPYCTAPLRGGVQIQAKNVITSDGPAERAICTAGFLVKSRSDQVPYLLTAGHCLKDAASATWTISGPRASNERTLGTLHRAIEDSRGDAGLLSLVAPFDTSFRRTIFVEASRRGDPNFTLARNEAYKIRRADVNKEGDIVCFMGRTSRARCAEILDNSVSFDGTDFLAAIDICSEPGDSGGPVFFKNLAYGIIKGRRVNPDTGRCLGQTFYTGARQAEGLLNVKVSG